MKKVFWIILVLVLIMLILGFLYSQGVIKVKWQWLAVILAAFAGPFNFLSNFFSGRNVKTDKLLKSQKLDMERLRKRREMYEVYQKQKNERIDELEAEVVKLKNEVTDLEFELKQKKKEVNNMTDINELQDAFMEAYNDKS